MLSTPALDGGCIPDGRGNQPCEWLGEVISLRVFERSALGHTKYLSGLSETREAKSPHPAQAYDWGRKDTFLRLLDTLYVIDSFEEHVPAEKLLKSFDAHLRRRGRAARLLRHYRVAVLVDLRRALTTVIDERLVKVVAWYDNEWGYSNRLVELAQSVFAPIPAFV